MSTGDEPSTPKRRHDEDSGVFSNDGNSPLFVPKNPERKKAKRDKAQLDETVKTEPDMSTSTDLDVSAMTDHDMSPLTEQSASGTRSAHFTLDTLNTDDQPRSAFFHPSRPYLEELVTDEVELVTRTYQQLNAEGLKDPDVERMITILSKYANPAASYEAPKPSAFIGRAGVGKSLTLSCIMNEPGISQDNQDTVRGTNVTIEFTHLRNDGQPQLTEDNSTQSKYVVCPTYFTDEEIRAKVWQICVDAFAFLESCDDNSDIKTEAQDLSSDSARSDNRERLKAYKSAVRYLVSLLRGETEFQSEEQIESFFKRMHAHRKTSLDGGNGTPNSLDDMMLVETANILTAPVLEFSQTRIGETVANNLTELKQVCNNMTKPGPTDRGHPWPTIDKVTVSVENPLLEAGAILGDTPGMSDEDQTVSESMRRYAKDAGALIICCALARSQQDSVVVEAIDLAVHLGKQRSTYLILTRIDDWRLERTEEEKLCTISADDAFVIKYAEEEKNSLVARQQVLNEEKERCINERAACSIRSAEIAADSRFPGDATLLAEFKDVVSRTQKLDATCTTAQVALDKLPDRIEEAQNRVKQCKLHACNRSDQRLLQAHLDEIKGNYAGKIREYSNNERDPDLPVFFVSGKQYQKGLMGLTGAEGPWLDNEATGIPSVKRKLYGLATATHFPKLKQMVSKDIPRLLSRSIAGLSKTPLAELTQIEIGIEVSIENSVKLVLECFFGGMNSAFAHHIEACFGTGNNGTTQAWMIEAKKVAKQLFEHDSRAFKTFCARKGNWPIKKLSWNRLLIGTYSQVIRSAWDDFMFESEVIQGHTIRLTNETFDNLRESLASGPYKGQRGYDEFLAAIQEAQNDSKAKVEDFWTDSLQDLEQVRTDLLLDSEHDPQSYVAQAMTPGYEAAAKMLSSSFPRTSKLPRSRAAHNARFAAVEKSILGTTSTADEPGLPNVFAAVKQIAHDDFDTKLRRTQARFEDLLKIEILDTLKADFSHRHGVSSDPNDQGAKARAKMLATLENSYRRLVEGDGKRLIAECEEAEK